MGEKDKAALARASENRLWAKDCADAGEALLAEVTRRCTTLQRADTPDGTSATPVVDQDRLGRLLRATMCAALVDVIAAATPGDDEDDEDPFGDLPGAGPHDPFSLVDPKP